MIPAIPNWQSLDAVQRSSAVLDWCVDSGIHTASILDYQLAAGMEAWEQSMFEERREMGEEYEYVASPADYVHQIRAIAAFLRSRI
jgi:hypothetical protein